MTPGATAGRRESIAAGVVLVTSLALVTTVVLLDRGVRVAAVLLLVIPLVVAHRWILASRTLLSCVLLIVLFVPMKRYTLPSSLPFHLELYRVAVAFVLVTWFLSLLVDRRVSLRKTGFERPLFLFVGAIALSLLLNRARVDAVSTDVVKSVMFFASYLLFLYAVVSIIRSARDIDFLVRLLVVGGGVLGFFTIVEALTTFNVFNHISSVLPILNYNAAGDISTTARGGHLRAYASAQHSIALGAAFAVLLPLAVYRACAFRRWIWFLPGLLMLLGLLATRSRTPVLMLLAIVLVYIVLRPAEVKRLWPAVVPLLIVVHFALPGTIGSLTQSFFPSGGLVAQQKHASVGSGRIATLGPALDSEFDPNPVAGEGFATRIVQPDQYVPVANAPILDDQWLGVLLETGLVGTVALAWFFARCLRRLGTAARRDYSPRGWLLAATTASVAAYFVSMFTYDAFAFIQVTFLLFTLIALGAATLFSDQEEWDRLELASARARRVAAAPVRLAGATR